MAQISYGSITIVDVTDIGQFSVYPRANSSKTQIYNSDANSYIPDWTSSHIIIKPVAYYAGRNITALASYTWKRRVAGGTEQNLITGEVYDSVKNELVISQNILGAINSGLITYICIANYTVDGIQLEARGEIDFSLVKQGSSAKVAKITGDNIFKINSSGNFINSSITLTAVINNTNISAWKYYNPADEQADANGYVVYPNSGNETTLTVRNTDSPVVNANSNSGNGLIKIKLVTTDSNTYDIFTITILRDGTNAQSSIAAILSNQVQMLPANDDGSLIGSLTEATTQLTIYEQGVNKTAEWTISKSPFGGVELVSGQANNVASISSMPQSSLTGGVTFTCSKEGFPPFTKEFNIVKIKAGSDGATPIIYSLQPDYLVVNEKYTYNQNGTLIATTRTPGVVRFNAYKQIGTTKSTYEGRIQFYINDSNTISSELNENREWREYNFNQNSSTTKVKAVLYEANANTKELDSQTVIVINDGSKGIQGPNGASGVNAINLVIQNEADVIPCDNNSHPFQNFLIDIPFEGYQGINKKPTSVTAPTLSKDIWGTSANITASTKNATASETGYVRYTIPTTATVPENGKITLNFSVTTDSNETVSISKIYTWTRSKAANDGANAVILTVTTPDGTVFENGEGILTIKGTLYDGPAEATGITYHYYNYSTTTSPASYVEITTVYDSNNPAPVSIATQNGKKVLKVKGTAVNGYASFKIDVTYNGHTYEDYVSLIDKTDPLQISVHSTIGTQIKNAQGVGCLYVRVTRDGTEIDPVPSNIVASITEPSGSNGDYYIKLTKPTSSNPTGSAQLMKHNGSTWVAQTSRCNYVWTYRNVNNVPLGNNDTKPATSGQFVYIDGTLIQNKITADVQVTLNESS